MMRTHLHRIAFPMLAVMAACSGNRLNLGKVGSDAADAPSGGGTGDGAGNDADAKGAGGADGGIAGADGTVEAGGGTGTDGAAETDSGPSISPETCIVPEGTMPRDKYAPGYTPDPAIQERVKSTLAGMSLDDAIAQMVGMPYGTASQPQFGQLQRSLDTSTLRGFRFRDGPRGGNLGEDIEGLRTDPGYSTVFPVSIGRGAAFDVDLEYAIGEAIADEMVAARQTLLLAPCVNLIRHPLWGRAQDAYSEDPYHTGRMASAMVVGIQQFIPANAKAFMGYSIETGRASNNTQMEDEQTLREIYGRHFRMVVRDAGVASVMAAYNKVNDTKCTNNAHLLTEVLRNDFGFKGFVLSDWFAMPNGTNVSTDASALKATAIEALKAGLDVELPWAFNYGQLKSLVSDGTLSRAEIDASASRVLEQKFRFKTESLIGPWGLKTPTTTYEALAIGNNEAHIALSQRAAEESMVLLKNENSTLPIPRTAKKIAVLGASVPYTTYLGQGTVDFASDIRTGNLGSSRAYFDPTKGVGPFDGIATAAGSGVSVVKGSKASDASDADFIVVMAGLTAEDEGEEYDGSGDRTSLALDDKNKTTVQNDLIAAAAALGKPMVVVLEGGSAIDMPWLPKVPAVVMAWYPGQVGGAALGRLLFGEISFSGKLPISWPASLESLPAFDGHGTTTFGYYVGYRYYDHQKLSPLFPFGHGLSYASFEYRKLRLGCSELTARSVLPVYVSVANTGSVDADEIVMVFVSFPGTKARRADKELKAFARVSLKAGETQEILIPVRVSDLDYWDNAQAKWVIESGEVKIHVGRSSADLPLFTSVRVQ